MGLPRTHVLPDLRRRLLRRRLPADHLWINNAAPSSHEAQHPAAAAVATPRAAARAHCRRLVSRCRRVLIGEVTESGIIERYIMPSDFLDYDTLTPFERYVLKPIWLLFMADAIIGSAICHLVKLALKR
jgi:hypothetical protein